MALERISATVLAQPLQGYRGQRQPAPGDTLRIAVNEASGDDLLATLEQGTVLRLKGLGYLAADLKAGEFLSMRVLATEPQLTLRLVDNRQSVREPAPAATLETPAMRVDQLALQRMLRPAPETLALALAWRGQVLSGLARHAVVSLAPEPTDMRLPAAGGWSFPAFAWAGIPVLLRLVEAEEDETHARKRRRGPGPAALWMEFALPAFGRLALRVQMAADGIFLLIAAEGEDALRQVRAGLPAIARALAAARLRLRRCQLSHGLPDPAAMHGWAEHGRRAVADALPAALFRAASEVTVALAALPLEARISGL